MKNCFLSYHHENDEHYVDELRKLCVGNYLIDYSLKYDISHLTDDTIYKKIRDKLRRSSVTIILIGERTGDRLWIDREIWASLRGYDHPYDWTRSFKPNGLLGIYLPEHTLCVPDRLQDNIDSGYAVTMKWRNVERDLEKKVELAAFNRSTKRHLIRNERVRMDDNYSRFLGFRF